MAFAGLFQHGCHFYTIQAAGRYKVEDAQVVLDVYCHTVIGYKFRYAHTNRGDFARMPYVAYRMSLRLD